MHFLTFVPYYAFWHYGRAVRDLLGNLAAILKFVVRLFSIPQLFSTLFAPWERMGEQYKKRVDFEGWAETFVLNSVLRVLGFFIKSVTIIVGLFTLVITSLLCALMLLVWFIMPIIILILFVSSLTTLL